MASGPITSWQIDGETVETVIDFIFGGSKSHCGWWLQPWNEKMLAPWKKSYDQPRQHIKKQRHYFANKGPYSQSYGFSNSHVWMWELDSKESWALKNWCFWIVVLEKQKILRRGGKNTQKNCTKTIFIARSHQGRSHPWQGHVEEIWRARQIITQGTPWICSSIYPKTKICLLFIILCLSPTLLTLTGGYPQPPFSGKNQLRALVNGHDRSVSIETSLMAF